MRKINLSNIKAAVMALVGGSALAGGAAFAQTSADYSTILSGLDTTKAVAAVIGAGVLLASVGFAKWATKKVARFFG